MTFYGVISAILFLGSCRQIFIALEHGSCSEFVMAGCLAIFVFNDALFTSHHVEGEDPHVPYRLPLQLIDLFNFLFLVAALVVVDPGDNIFMTGAKRVPGWCSEWEFWMLLAIYWFFINVWTSFAGIYKSKGYPIRLRYLSIGIIILLVLTAGSSMASHDIQGLRCTTFLFVLIYIAVIRPLALNEAARDAKAAEAVVTTVA